MTKPSKKFEHMSSALKCGRGRKNLDYNRMEKRKQRASAPALFHEIFMTLKTLKPKIEERLIKESVLLLRHRMNTIMRVLDFIFWRATNRKCLSHIKRMCIYP